MKRLQKIGLTGIALLAGFGLLLQPTQASAAKVGIDEQNDLANAPDYLNFQATGKNALYSYPAPLKSSAKVVASVNTMKKLAKKGTYFRAYKRIILSQGNGLTYFKVVSFDGKYRGYIYAGIGSDDGNTNYGSIDNYNGGLKHVFTAFTTTIPTNTTVYVNSAKKNGLWNAPANTRYKAKKIVTSLKPYAGVALTVTKAKFTQSGLRYYYVKPTDSGLKAGWIYAGALKGDAAKGAATGGKATSVKKVYETDLDMPVKARDYRDNSNYPIYSYPRSLKPKAKVVASKSTLHNLKKPGMLFRAYRQLVTTDSKVYPKVVSYDGKYRGYAYAGTTSFDRIPGVYDADTRSGLWPILNIRDVKVPDNRTVYLKAGTKNGVWNAPYMTTYGAKKIASDMKPYEGDALTVTKAMEKSHPFSNEFPETSYKKKIDVYYYVKSANPSFKSGWIYSGAVTNQAPSKNTVKVNFVQDTKNGTLPPNGVLQNKRAKDGQTVAASDINPANIAVPAGFTLDTAANNAETLTAKYGSNDVLTVHLKANRLINLLDTLKAYGVGQNNTMSIADYYKGTIDDLKKPKNFMTMAAKDPFFQQPEGSEFTAEELYQHIRAAGGLSFYRLIESNQTVTSYSLNENYLSDGVFGKANSVPYGESAGMSIYDFEH